MVSRLAGQGQADPTGRQYGRKTQQAYQDYEDRWTPTLGRNHLIKDAVVEPAPAHGMQVEMTPAGAYEVSGVTASPNASHLHQVTVSGSALSGGYTRTGTDGMERGVDATVNWYETRLTGTVGQDLKGRIPGSESAVLYETFGLADIGKKLGVVGEVDFATDFGTAFLGAKLSLSGDRAVSYQGPYSGDNPELAGQHKVEMRYEKEATVQGTLGFASHGVGLFGRLEAIQGKQVIYRTHLSANEAADRVENNKGLRQGISGKLEAIGLKAQTLPIPRLDQPESWQVGDELSVETQGKLKGGVFGGYGISVTAVGQMEGQFLLKGKKLDDRHVELTVTPRSLSSLGATFNTPLVDAFSAKGALVSLTQSFVFDLEDPAALTAYQDALKGDLPTNLPASVTEPGPVADREAIRLLTAVRLESLPSGVKRTLLEKAEIPIRARNIDSRLTLLPKSFGLGGLTGQELRSHGKVVVTDGQAALTKNARAYERAKEGFLSGRQSRQVVAEAFTLTSTTPNGRPITELDRVVVSAEIRNTETRDKTQNTRILDPLNKTFGLSVPQYERKGRKQDRKISAKLELAPRDLQRLGMSGSQNILDAVQATGAPKKATQTLISKLQGEPDPLKAAAHVQAYVQDQKLAGFGVIYRLLDNPEQLELSTASSAYTTPVSEVDTLALQHPELAQLEDGKAALRERFTKTHSALKNIKEALLDLDDDAVLKTQPKVFEQRKVALLNARKSAQAIINLDHLDRPDRLAVYKQVKTESVLEDADQLLSQYSGRITADTSLGQLEDRFADIPPIIFAIKEKQTLLEKDEAMNRVDPEGTRATQSQLEDTRKALEAQLSWQHLSDAEQGQIRDRIDRHPFLGLTVAMTYAKLD